MRNNIAVVKDLATNLIDQLKRQGIAIKRTGALEVISQLQNHTDWNRYRAKLTSENRPRQMQKACVKTKVLLGRPGTGKTEALKTILSLESAEGSSHSLYFCFSGCGLWYHHEKDKFLPKKVNYWKVLYNRFGLREVIHPEVLVDAPHIVDMRPTETRMQEGLQEAFKSFMTRYQSDLSSVRIGSILVDEFFRLGRDHEKQFFEVISDFCAVQKFPVRCMVISTQCELDDYSAIDTDRDPLNYVCEQYMSKRQPYAPAEFMPIGGDKNWRSTSLDDENLLYDIFSAVTGAIARKTKRGERENPDLGRFSYFVNGPAWARALIPKSKAI